MIKDEKFYTWDELVEKFPGMWVIIEDPELTEAGFIRSGKLIGVCDDTEVDEFVISCYKENKKISYERTTEESGVGTVNVQDFKFAVK